jgi:Methyltransferase domain
VVIPERLTDDMTGPQRDGHEFRYHLAAGLLRPGDIVLDAACGTGYGAPILAPHGSQVGYRGVDLVDPAMLHTCRLHHSVIVADLTKWEPRFTFEVAVGFETIEHLPDYRHYVSILKRAHRWIVLSAPVVPTVGINPYHCHDFVPGDLALIIEDDDWRLFQTVQQPSEVSEISVFRRR